MSAQVRKITIRKKPKLFNNVNIPLDQINLIGYLPLQDHPNFPLEEDIVIELRNRGELTRNKNQDHDKELLDNHEIAEVYLSYMNIVKKKQELKEFWEKKILEWEILDKISCKSEEEEKRYLFAYEKREKIKERHNLEVAKINKKIGDLENTLNTRVKILRIDQEFINLSPIEKVLLDDKDEEVIKPKLVPIGYKNRDRSITKVTKKSNTRVIGKTQEKKSVERITIPDIRGGITNTKCIKDQETKRLTIETKIKPSVQRMIAIIKSDPRLSILYKKKELKSKAKLDQMTEEDAKEHKHSPIEDIINYVECKSGKGTIDKRQIKNTTEIKPQVRMSVPKFKREAEDILLLDLDIKKEKSLSTANNLGKIPLTPIDSLLEFKKEALIEKLGSRLQTTDLFVYYINWYRTKYGIAAPIKDVRSWGRVISEKKLFRVRKVSTKFVVDYEIKTE